MLTEILKLKPILLKRLKKEAFNLNSTTLKEESLKRVYCLGGLIYVLILGEDANKQLSSATVHMLYRTIFETFCTIIALLKDSGLVGNLEYKFLDILVQDTIHLKENTSRFKDLFPEGFIPDLSEQLKRLGKEKEQLKNSGREALSPEDIIKIAGKQMGEMAETFERNYHQEVYGVGNRYVHFGKATLFAILQKDENGNTTFHLKEDPDLAHLKRHISLMIIQLVELLNHEYKIISEKKIEILKELLSEEFKLSQ